MPHATIDPPAPVQDPEGTTIVVRDPATGETVAEVPTADAAAIRDAVEAARGAFRGWADTPAGERAGVLKAWARALHAHADEIATLVTREMGKPAGDARGGVDAGIGAIEQYAELGPTHRGRRLAGAPDADDVMERHPRGVAAVLLPWNDPVALACAQIAACVVMGNTVVVKPSERAPLAVARAVELLPDALPAGVVTLIQGDGATGAALVAADGVDLVIHTGSVAAGRDIAVRCASLLRKAIVELGGKDALIVDRDVDPDWAARQAALGAFANAGQICVAVERILVHREIADPFVEALVREAEALRVGPGSDPETGMGPLVDERHRDGVHRHVAAAAEAGAQVRTGGVIPGGEGSFYPPTVLTDVTPDMDVWREETFGPVAPVIVVDDFDEALRLAGDTEYGLAGTVLTADERHARRATRELDVGTLKVNAVFGGAPGGAAEPRRSSGLGLGYGPELLDEVSAWRVVHRSAPVPRA
ncbi:aldehyde dehydrogenase family protein [Patulibacter sp. SYSU D01012]|uniref:aldehyde dehydrogenase family protein n=1 Tax=Patulibacter sp. SYSU D01012 TaxID=2817381 RepID=UPI001B30815D